MGPSIESSQCSWLAHLAAGGVDVVRADYDRRGARVAAFRLTPAAARGRLVMAHATGNDALYPHASLVRAALDARYEVFLFDLDGHGASSSTVLDEAHARTMIASALAAASRDVPKRTTVLAGQSLGAALVLAAAGDAAQPSLVHAVIAISAPSALVLNAASGAAELRTLVAKEFWRLTRDYGFFGALPALGPFRRRAFPVRLATGRGAAFRYPSVISRLVRGLNLTAVAACVRCPSLLVYGAKDKIVPVAQGRELARALPRGRLVEIQGATHFTTPLAAETRREVSAFLQDLGKDA